MNTADPIIEDVGKSTKAYILKNHRGYVIAYIVFIVLVAILILFANLGMGLIVIPLMVGVIVYGYFQTKIKRQFTQQFGASIGFSFAPTADFSGVTGRLLESIGHDKRIYDVLSGQKDGRDTRIFSTTVRVGSGKNSEDISFTVFEMTFSNMMPDIILISKGNPFSENLARSSIGEHIELEGDFNKYFALKVAKGYETEAYQTLTPDIMADLIDRAKDLNFEFNMNKLYIYANGLILERDKLQAMFDLAEWLSGLFSRSTRAVNVPAAAAQNV